MSQQIDDGGAAFPVAGGCVSSPGMPLRDWFAGQALANISGEYTAWGDITPQAKQHAMVIAEHAYNIADAMLAARKGGDQ